jgi:hypothetical protein
MQVGEAAAVVEAVDRRLFDLGKIDQREDRHTRAIGEDNGDVGM